MNLKNRSNKKNILKKNRKLKDSEI